MVHLTDLALRNFTCFSDLEISFSPGVNIFIGANGTGKTHILKVLYAACAITTKAAVESDLLYENKLINTFSPLSSSYGLLLRQPTKAKECIIELKNSQRNTCKCKIKIPFGPPTYLPSKEWHASAESDGNNIWQQEEIPSVYIPAKEFLSHTPGFLSLVKTRRLAFDEIYPDLLTQAYLPHLIESPFQELQAELLKALKGDDVILRGETFHLKSGNQEFEFSFIAEGLKKIALLFWLIQTGSIAPGTILFWDEPEANMNPILLNLVVKSLLTFQRAGIQIFLTTHNYVLLKEFDLQSAEEDNIRYFSLYFDAGKDGVQASFSDTYLGIENSEIANTYTDLFNRDMERKLKGYM